MTSGTQPTLKLYDTYSRQKQDFTPLDAGNVRMYVCGPTVYDYAHIGNARPVIVFDVLFRLLRHVYGEDHVTYVRNITDVDDKINARAARDFPDLPLNEAIRRVTEKTTNQFHADVKRLGCLEPTVEPRATDFILPRADGKADMTSLIQTLLDRKCAYIAEGREGLEVLFDTVAMPNYGQLSKRPLDEQQAGARIAVEDHKKTPGDFVLWKQSSADEPGWAATFTENGKTTEIFGRPGWHIECSAMSAAYLGDIFDIHGGGLDLIFPHHENEMAQSCCAHGTDKMAQIWMHNGFLQVEGQKMSKSLGNFVTIHELLETEKFGGRKWPGEVLRLAMLMTHYRQPIDFSVARLEEAWAIIRRWADAKLKINEAFGAELAAVSAKIPLDSPILDDLNLVPVIANMHELGRSGAAGDARAAASFHASLQLLGFDEIEILAQSVSNLGLSLDGDHLADVDGKIQARLEALNAKDFAKADEIRAELLEQGIQLMDYKDPETGERKTKWEVKR